MHVVIVGAGTDPFIISKNSLEFPEYMQRGFEILKEGSKSECEEFAEELQTELI